MDQDFDQTMVNVRMKGAMVLILILILIWTAN